VAKIKKIKIKADMLRSVSKQTGESVESVARKKRKEGYGVKDLQKRKVRSFSSFLSVLDPCTGALD